ncbi:MAG: hypothetical protein IJY55_01025 [Clostridia bacterium]|nr:hypothetical protein [Clostridia bacterium]
MPRRYETTNMGPFIVLAVLAALVCTILIFVMVLPENKRAGLNNFFKKVADIFNFKNLLLESILKFLYTISTLFVIFYGFFTLFSEVYGESMFFAGLATMVLGPIVIRITYERSIMFVLLVKNVIEINKKMYVSTGQKKAEAPKAATVVEPAEKRCPGCNIVVDPDAAFCTNCGQQLKQLKFMHSRKCIKRF